MVNINVTIPAELLERFMFHVERIANAVERLAGPVIPAEPPKPYPSTMWGYTSNAESIRIEEEERLEATGYGRSYQRDLIARAATVRAEPQTDPSTDDRSHHDS